MFEKLLLAATITFALNLFLGVTSPTGTPTESGLFSFQLPALSESLPQDDDGVPMQQTASSSVQLLHLR